MSLGGGAARTARRLPHPGRDRPRRHGHRLRGVSGIAGPARRREGAAPQSLPDPSSCSGSSARRRRPPGCTTPTSSRCSASASRTVSLHRHAADPGRRAGRGPRQAPRGRRQWNRRGGRAGTGRGRSRSPAAAAKSRAWQEACSTGPSSSAGPATEDFQVDQDTQVNGCGRSGERTRCRTAGPQRGVAGRPGLLAERGHHRAAGGRCPALRPRASHAAPRYQTGQSAAGLAGRGVDHRFRTGQGDGPGPRDPDRRLAGTLRYMAPEQFSGQVGRAERHLQSGADPVRVAHSAAGV